MTSIHRVRKSSWWGTFRPLALVLATIGILTVGVPVAPANGATRSVARAPQPGAWAQLGTAQGQSAAALVHVAGGKDLVAWLAPVASGKAHYDAVELKPHGGIAAAPVDVFGGHDWGGVTAFPTLLKQGNNPLLVFEGGRTSNPSDAYSHGCVVGVKRSASAWVLQKWSLSTDCVNDDHFGATITHDGTLSAAWPGGWAGGNGVLYHIGVSSTIPAANTDQHISTATGDAGSVSETADNRGQDVYAAWMRFFSKPTTKDGLWAADLSKNASPVKAPDTGTNTVTNFPEPVALASPAKKGGVYLAYCDNGSPCGKVELWRYGTKTARTVPGSSSPKAVALSAGPAGRLWIAWWSPTNGTVRVVRTNEAATRFGPVKTYAGPHGCKGDANATIRISSGSQQRLDVVMTCYDYTGSGTHASATQSLVPLQIGASTTAINVKTGGRVTYRVSDVGDPVKGSRVVVGGMQGRTNARGQVTFRVKAGAHAGTLLVVARKPNYLSAATVLHIQ